LTDPTNVVNYRTMAFQFHTISYYLVGFNERQLATVPTAADRVLLVDAIENIGGVPEGDWYRFANLADIQETIRRTRDLGGVVYNLPVRNP
jgi:hypothetical protein